ncbi:MAG TPA: AbrB/MazE/SpoVT family DNA-binding domain-containing protein, partial [Clostridia bacterium]|nr:AbrB/MazE/SpoVT family DNA-binding domain-containing protein [Clostridia bacterium]
MKAKSPDANHYMSCVKVGPKGQIVIPKEVRDMFGIQPGDSLLLLADSQRGIALE